jgi:hypothetical protein
MGSLELMAHMNCVGSTAGAMKPGVDGSNIEGVNGRVDEPA